LDAADLLSHIPQPQIEPLKKRLLEIVLKSKNASYLPERLAKGMLNTYYRGEFSSPNGLQMLLDVSLSLEKEKTLETLRELGLAEAVKALGG